MGETDLKVASLADGVGTPPMGETDLKVASLADGVGTPPMGETDLKVASLADGVGTTPMGETDLKVASLADGVGTASAETDCGVGLRGHDPEDVADAPVGRAGGQEGFAPRIHRHEHLR